jgi:hypothetical protein
LFMITYCDFNWIVFSCTCARRNAYSRRTIECYRETSKAFTL